MQLYELEISNFKCLDNYKMPLRFSNLNLLIGENDSGKTSLLEAIRILLNKKNMQSIDIQSNMFFDLKKDINITGRFSSTNQKILEDALIMQGLELSHYEYLNNYDNTGNTFINQDWHPYEGSIHQYYFNDYISKYLKKFSFYEDLKNFYKEYLSDYLITIDKTFSINNQNKFNKHKIIVEEVIFFDLKHSKSLDKLLESSGFTLFMMDYTEKFHGKCVELMNEIIYKEHFSFNKLSGNLGNMSLEISDRNEVGELVPNEEKCLEQILVLERLTNSIIFLDDDEEMILGKIANLIAVFINNTNCEKVNWDIGGFIKHPNINVMRPPKEMRPTGIQTNIFNIINHTLGSTEDCEIIEKFELPEFKLSNMEIVNEKVPYEFFNNLYNTEAVEEILSDEITKMIKKEIVKDSIENFLLEKGLANEFFINGVKNNIKKYMHALDEDLDDINIKFELSDNFYKELNKIIELDVKIEIKENSKDVDLTQKGQGFLNKLMLSSYLLLVKDYNKLITDGESENKNIIILIEEPEIHLHHNAQLKVIELLKKNLSTSNNQVFITTHSHFIMRNISPENYYVFKREKSIGVSSISNIAQQYHYDFDIFKKVENSLGVSYTDLLFLKKVILIVEGKHDIAFIKGLCRNPKFNINSGEILFIDSDGQFNVDYFIGLGAFLKKKVLIILDKHKDNFLKREALIKLIGNGKSFFNAKIRNSILEINVLEKPDILDYLYSETDFIEKYFGLPEGCLKQSEKKELFKDILHNKIRNFRSEDIEYLVSELKFIEKELITKIIEPIERFKPL